MTAGGGQGRAGGDRGQSPARAFDFPTLATARLALRLPELADVEHRAASHASDRPVWEGGPFDRRTAWRIFAAEVGQWPLMGHGPSGVTMEGASAGEVGIYHAAGDPGPERGWSVLPAHEGKGIAAEAAQAVTPRARAAFGWTRLVSIIDPGNLRSIATAPRIGGVIDPALPGIDPGDVAVRHDLVAA